MHKPNKFTVSLMKGLHREFHYVSLLNINTTPRSKNKNIILPQVVLTPVNQTITAEETTNSSVSHTVGSPPYPRGMQRPPVDA